METNSEGENQNRGTSGGNNNIGNSNEGQSKPKRQMKTPFQLEALEKAYACPCTSFLMLLLFFFWAYGCSDWLLLQFCDFLCFFFFSLFFFPFVLFVFLCICYCMQMLIFCSFTVCMCLFILLNFCEVNEFCCLYG